jgi:hypothetical protein
MSSKAEGLQSGNGSPMEAPPSPLSSRAKPRDLQFRGPLLEVFFDRGAVLSSTIYGFMVGRSRTSLTNEVEAWVTSRETTWATSSG